MTPLIEKIYPGKIARPKVHTIQNSTTENSIFIYTQWGEPFDIESILNEPLDSEATQPSHKIKHSPEESKILKTFEKVNFKLYEGANKKNYSSGIEALYIILSSGKITWAQIGQPSLYIIRNGKPIALSPAKDLSVEFNQTAPLPSELLGINKQLQLKVHDFHMEENDQLFFYYGRPTNFPAASNFEIEKIFNCLITENPSHSFWLAKM